MATTATAIYPGASTFPNTNVYPGQGTLPIVRARISTDDFSVSVLTWTEVTTRIRSYSTTRGRNSELEDFDAGTATLVLDNRDRAYDPNVNAAVRPRNRIWIYEEFSGEVHDLFKGYAESWTATWDPSGIADAVTTVQASDEVRVLNGQVFASTLTITALPHHAAFLAALDAIVVPTAVGSTTNQAPRSITASGSGSDLNITLTAAAQTVAASTLNDIARSAIPNTAGGTSRASDASWFVSASGTVTFIPWNIRSLSAIYGTPQVTFGDGGGAELPYLDLTLDYSSSFLFNTWTLTGNDGTVTASDSASVIQYGTVAESRTLAINVLGVNGPVNNFVDKYKTPFQRITSIAPKMQDAATAEAVYRRDLCECIEIIRRPPGGGSPIDEAFFIQRIEHSGTPGSPPKCVLGVSPL